MLMLKQAQTRIRRGFFLSVNPTSDNRIGEAPSARTPGARRQAVISAIRRKMVRGDGAILTAQDLRTLRDVSC